MYNIQLNSFANAMKRSWRNVMLISAASLAFFGPMHADSYFSWLPSLPSWQSLPTLPTFSLPSMPARPQWLPSQLPTWQDSVASAQDFFASRTGMISTGLAAAVALGTWWKLSARGPQVFVPANTVDTPQGGDLLPANTVQVNEPVVTPYVAPWTNDPWELLANPEQPIGRTSKSALSVTTAPGSTNNSEPSEWMQNVQKGFAGGWQIKRAGPLVKAKGNKCDVRAYCWIILDRRASVTRLRLCIALTFIHA